MELFVVRYRVRRAFKVAITQINTLHCAQIYRYAASQKFEHAKPISVLLACIIAHTPPVDTVQSLGVLSSDLFKKVLILDLEFKTF